MWWKYTLAWFIGFVMGGMVWFEIYCRVKYNRKRDEL